MNYGTSAYGSTSLGGIAASQWYTFFVFDTAYPTDTLLEAQLEFGGSTQFFSLFSQQGNDSGEGVSYKAYTSNDPHETPQLQTTFGGVGQAVIGSARFITVTAQFDSAVWGPFFGFSIIGRPGD